MDQNNIQLKEIKPFLSGYISKALYLLKKGVIPDDDAVHDIRVLMKKARAALKLVASGPDNELYGKDLQDLKRVGKIMSEWRDTSVHRRTLKELRKSYPKIFSELQSNERISFLMQKPISTTEPDEQLRTRIDEICTLLSKTGFRIRFHQMQNIEYRVLLEQLEISHRIVAGIYLECRNWPRPEKIHEFRKRSKDFLYQLYFFRPFDPHLIKSLEKKFDTMTMYLGKYNDLSQLISALEYSHLNQSNPSALDELIIKIRERQDIYLSKVWPVAFKCFCPGVRLTDLAGFKLVVI